MSNAAPTAWLPASHTRSRSVMLALAVIIGLETLGLHLWLRQRHPALAWTLTGLSLLGLAWLAGDYHALSTAGLRLGSGGCEVRIGARARADVPWTAVEQIRMPTWRDLPGPSPEYLNTARPDDPNVLLTFRTPVVLRSVVGPRRVRQLGLRLTEPERVVEHWQQWVRGEAPDTEPTTAA